MSRPATPPQSRRKQQPPFLFTNCNLPENLPQVLKRYFTLQKLPFSIHSLDPEWLASNVPTSSPDLLLKGFSLPEQCIVTFWIYLSPWFLSQVHNLKTEIRRARRRLDNKNSPGLRLVFVRLSSSLESKELMLKLSFKLDPTNILCSVVQLRTGGRAKICSARRPCCGQSWTWGALKEHELCRRKLWFLRSRVLCLYRRKSSVVVTRPGKEQCARAGGRVVNHCIIDSLRQLFTVSTIHRFTDSPVYPIVPLMSGRL